ncbi:MAG: carboxymuconolactone decarboxylase family protein [Candidatus Binataceae bacterium]
MSDRTSPVTTPRIPPITPSQWTDEVRAYFAQREETGSQPGLSKLNITLTLAHHPDLAIPYLNFGMHILNRSTLSARVREIATLRTAWLYRSDYQWDKHPQGAKNIGMTAEEIEAIKAGADAPVWSKFERYVLRAADQLRNDVAIDDETWNGLAEHLDRRQLLDFLFTVGSYAMLAMVLNGIRVQLEPEG